MAKNPTCNIFSTSSLVLIMAAVAIFAASANAKSRLRAPVAAPRVSPMAAPRVSPVAEPAPAPGPDCFAYLLNLSDCLTYVQQGSNLTKPEKPCCPEVKKLVNDQPICLCELLAHPDQSPFPIDVRRAFRLPTVCKLNLPFAPESGCSLLGVPIAAPAPAPSPAGLSAPEPSSGGTTLSPEGLPSSPSSTPNGNGAQRIAGSQRHFLLGLLVIAIFASLF